MAIPTREDVLAIGLPAAALQVAGVLPERIDGPTGRIFVRGHGVSSDDAATCTLRLLPSTLLGALPPTLPTGLDEATLYYLRPVSPDALRLAPGPLPTPAIASYASTGDKFELCYDFGPTLDAAIAEAHAIVQAAAMGYGSNVVADIVHKATVALAGWLYVHRAGAADPSKAASYLPLTTIWTELYKPMVDRWSKGATIKGATDASPGVVETRSRYRPASSSRSGGFGSMEDRV